MRAGRFVSPQRDPSTGRYVRNRSGDEATADGLAAQATAAAALADHGAHAPSADGAGRKPPAPGEAAAVSPPDACSRKCA